MTAKMTFYKKEFIEIKTGKTTWKTIYKIINHGEINKQSSQFAPKTEIETAEELNQYVTTIEATLVSSIPNTPNTMNNSTSEWMFFVTVTPEEIKPLIKKTNSRKASGHYDIKPNWLKQCNIDMVNILCKSINLSFTSAP